MINITLNKNNTVSIKDNETILGKTVWYKLSDGSLKRGKIVSLETDMDNLWYYKPEGHDSFIRRSSILTDEEYNRRVAWVENMGYLFRGKELLGYPD